MKNSKSLQQQFRNKKFDYHQYWDILYIEDYTDGSHKTFSTIVKAKSAFLAKKIIRQKIDEDNPGTKVKFYQINMFHKNYYSKKYGKLGVAEWSNIRAAAFPNISNVLHKKHMPNLDGLRESKRESLARIRKLKGLEDRIGFKKGADNWSTMHRWKEALPEEEREGKIWTGGAWVDWDKEDMEKVKNKIINALIINNNVRMKAAEYLGIDRNALRMLMSRIPNFDWNKDYPPPKPFENANREIDDEERAAMSERMKKVMAERMANGVKPFGHLSEEELNAARKKGREACLRKRKAKIKLNIPIIKKALKANNNIRARAAKSLGKSPKWIKYWMDSSSHIINWDKEYPQNIKSQQK
tara:strand:- start:6810 stop:7874 length:1065 start_codon:yes stop_codon:yes gene_type:complete